MWVALKFDLLLLSCCLFVCSQICEIWLDVQVEVVALSSYEEKEEQFNEQVYENCNFWEFIDYYMFLFSISYPLILFGYFV